MIAAILRKVILSCRKYPKVFFSLVILNIGFGVYYINQYLLYSTAIATFYVDGSMGFQEYFYGEKPDVRLGAIYDNERIIRFAYSMEMTDFLINKFDLYRHYGIDPAQR